jgi:hypothetical protein
MVKLFLRKKLLMIFALSFVFIFLPSFHSEVGLSLSWNKEDLQKKGKPISYLYALEVDEGRLLFSSNVKLNLDEDLVTTNKVAVLSEGSFWDPLACSKMPTVSHGRYLYLRDFYQKQNGRSGDILYRYSLGSNVLESVKVPSPMVGDIYKGNDGLFFFFTKNNKLYQFAVDSKKVTLVDIPEDVRIQDFVFAISSPSFKVTDSALVLRSYTFKENTHTFEEDNETPQKNVFTVDGQLYRRVPRSDYIFSEQIINKERVRLLFKDGKSEPLVTYKGEGELYFISLVQ